MHSWIFIHSFLNCLSWGIDGGGGNPTEIMIIRNVACFVHACAVYSVSQPQQSQQHTTCNINYEYLNFFIMYPSQLYLENKIGFGQ